MKLTRGGWALLGLLALIAGMTPSSNPTIFIVIAVLAAMLVLNVPLALMAVRGFSLRRDHPTHVREGAAVRVSLHVVNKTRFARTLLRFCDTIPGRTDPELVQLPLLEPGGRHAVVYTCRAARRGVYALRTCRIESSSPFGLVDAHVSVPARSDLVVYPIYYDLAGAPLPFHKSYSGITAAPGARPGEGLSFFGLREYRPGDPIRKIHWPTTVRTRKVMIKEFEEDVHSTVAIILDSHHRSLARGMNDDTNLEVAIRAAASFANHMLVCGHPLVFNCADAATGAILSCKTAGDLTPVLDALARLEPGPLPAVDLLAACEGTTSRMPNWIVLLLSPERRALERLLRARSQGIEIVLVIGHGVRATEVGTGSDAAGGKLLDMLAGAGVRIIDLAVGDDIQGRLMTGLKNPGKIRSMP